MQKNRLKQNKKRGLRIFFMVFEALEGICGNAVNIYCKIVQSVLLEPKRKLNIRCT